MRDDVERRELLTTKQAAKVCKITPGTMRKWRCKGIGPDYIKVGSAVRYEQAALDRWLGEQTTTPRSPVIRRAPGGSPQGWLDVADVYISIAREAEGAEKRDAIEQAREALLQAEGGCR